MNAVIYWMTAIGYIAGSGVTLMLAWERINAATRIREQDLKEAREEIIRLRIQIAGLIGR